MSNQSPRASLDTDYAEEELSLLDYLLVFAQQKMLVLGFPALVGMISILVSLLVPNWYTGSSKILPPQQSQSSALAILGQLGPLAGGATQALGLRNPSDIYVAMLRSRTIADRLIERFDLKNAYGEEYLVSTRKALESNTVIAAGRDGVIGVDVDDRSPQRAAELANAYVEELRSLSGRLAVSEAGQRRLFFESQLKKAKNDLLVSEAELLTFSQHAGLVNPQSQIQLSIATAAALHAQIAAKEVQLRSLRAFATGSNPELTRATHELNGLRAELAKMEKSSAVSKGDVMVPFGKAPEVGLEYIRKYRDMKYFEALFEALAKQLEIARIDEAKEATVIQVLDIAVPPERKSGPKRAALVLVSVFVAGIVAALIAIFRNSYRRSMTHPELAARIGLLRSLLVIGRNR